MAATLTTTPGAPSTSLQRLHHVEKVVSRTFLSLSLSLDACFSATAKSFQLKRKLTSAFLFEYALLLWYLKEGKKNFLQKIALLEQSCFERYHRVILFLFFSKIENNCWVVLLWIQKNHRDHRSTICCHVGISQILLPCFGVHKFCFQ